MSVDSFGMAMASLPAPTPPSAPSSVDAVPAEKQAASDNSSTTSASSTDPLMAALQQTLSQLGYSMPAGSLTSTGTSGADSADGSSTSGVSASSSDATSTGAQFLAALYQALALQQSISADNGGTSSGNSSSNAIASFNDSATSGGGVSAYRDLGSRIADLSNAANAVDNDADDDAGEWDVEVDDVEVSEPEEAEDGEDPLGSAVSNLNNALQAHVAALDSDPGTTVTLSDVLDGLSGTASSLNWQPVGVLVDVSA
jgi:peptidoglycan hydrolase-like protein with peptidoglycan-binding domain